MDLDLNTFSMYDLVENCFEVISLQAEDLSVEVINRVSETESMITADYNIMQRVLTNLLSNAIEYSPENSQVEVVMISEEQWVHIHVKDQGGGISGGVIMIRDNIPTGTDIGIYIPKKLENKDQE